MVGSWVSINFKIIEQSLSDCVNRMLGYLQLQDFDFPTSISHYIFFIVASYIVTYHFTN